MLSDKTRLSDVKNMSFTDGNTLKHISTFKVTNQYNEYKNGEYNSCFSSHFIL